MRTLQYICRQMWKLLHYKIHNQRQQNSHACVPFKLGLDMFKLGGDIWVSLGNTNRCASSLGALNDKNSVRNAEKLKLLKKKKH
jgi:hypothetical protein